MTLVLDSEAAFREAFASALQARPRRWATPGAMACDLDSRMVQTPALERVDQALVDLAEGRDRRLMVFAPPQEGKVSVAPGSSRCGCWSRTPTSA